LRPLGHANGFVATGDGFLATGQQKYAPFVCLGAEVLALVILSLVSFELPSTGGTIRISIDWAAEWQQVVHQPLEIAALGIVAGIVLTTCRATSRQLLPGVEEPDENLVPYGYCRMPWMGTLPCPLRTTSDMRVATGNCSVQRERRLRRSISPS
jgi:hypothetical protein